MKRIVLVFLVGFLFVACREEKGTVIRMETSSGNIRIRLYDETVLHRANIIRLVREGYYDGMLFHRVIRDFMIQAGDPDSKSTRPGMLLGAKDASYTVEAEILPRYFHKKGAFAAARESDQVNPERNSSGSHFYIVKGKVFTPEELDDEVERINNKRYTALFNRLKTARESEIMQRQLVDDYEALMRINRELSDTTHARFDRVKLKLSDEQRKAYMTVGGTPHLDGEYTVFGEVIGGIEVVDRIVVAEVDDNYRPLEDAVIRKMVIE